MTGDPGANAGAAAHIGIVFHDFPPGGSERIMIRLANAWATGGRRVTILCGDDSGPARALVGSGVAVQRVDPAIPRGPLSRWRLGRRLRGVLPALDLDVLVAPGNFHIPVIGALGRPAVPLVCKLSNPIERSARGPFSRALFLAFTRHLTRHVDLLVAISTALRAEAEGLLSAPVAYAPQPVLPVEWQAPPRARGGAGPHILVAGRLEPQKDVGLALQTLAVLPGARMTIAGDGAERPALERLAARLGLAERVRFLGTVPSILPLLGEADALLSTSRFEGYPSVLVEAIAAGVPVVTTPSTPALRELLSDPAFGIVADADAALLAAGIALVSTRAGPAGAALDAFRARHGAADAADAWLALLDRVAAARATAIAPILDFAPAVAMR